MQLRRYELAITPIQIEVSQKVVEESWNSLRKMKSKDA